MKIFDSAKIVELLPEQCDPRRGELHPDKLLIAHHEAVPPQEARGHETVTAIHADGTIEYEWVEDEPGTEGRPAYDEYEDILVYVPYTAEELERREIDELRDRRKNECFAVVDRGRMWYETLTPEGLAELRAWYEAWLDVTKTKVIPERPAWVDGKIENEEVIL